MWRTSDVAAASAALVAMAAGVYLNTLHADFTFDDQFAILSNRDVLDGALYTPSLTRAIPSPIARRFSVIVDENNVGGDAAAAADGDGGNAHLDVTSSSSSVASPAGSYTTTTTRRSGKSGGGGGGGGASPQQPRPPPPLLGLWTGSLWVNDFWGQNLTSEGSHKSWRPLTVLSFRLNAAVGGLEPTPPENPEDDDSGGGGGDDDGGGAEGGGGGGDDGTSGRRRRMSGDDAKDPKPKKPKANNGTGGGDSTTMRPRPFGFHCLNVILHCAVTLLVHRLALRIAAVGYTGGYAPRGSHGAVVRRQAFLAAALFAVHPVHTEVGAV